MNRRAALSAPLLLFIAGVPPSVKLSFCTVSGDDDGLYAAEKRSDGAVRVSRYSALTQQWTTYGGFSTPSGSNANE